MVRKILFISFLLCSLSTPCLLGTPSLEWVKLIDSSNSECPHSLTQSSDGYILIFCNFGSRTDNSPVYYDGVETGLGCATNSNSDNYNALFLKTDPDGNKLWSVYSNAGDITLNSSCIAATRDGGAVAALKMRYASGYPDRNPAFTDASGNIITIPDWNNGYRTNYIVIVKISKDGNIEWTKTIDIDNSPEPNATYYTEGTPDAIYANGIITDDNDNIYIGGNYRKTITLVNSDGGNVQLTPHNTEGWDGDSQKVVGDMFLIKFDGNGDYIKHLTTTGIDTRDQITNLVYDSGKIYFTGNIQAATEGTPIAIGAQSVTPSLLDDILIGCADTTLNVSWATTITAYGASDNKHTTQIKNLELMDGNLYVMGLVKGGFGPSGSTAASIASTGSPLEGYVIKCDANDGSWIGGAVNGKSIGGYFGAIKGTEKNIYLYGYTLGTIFLDEYDETSWDKTTEYNLITGGGMSTAWSCLLSGKRLYTFTRCNSVAPSQYYNSDITTKSEGWGNLFARWNMADMVSKTSTATKETTKIYGVQNGIVIRSGETENIIIHDMAGRQILSAKTTGETTFIPFSKGIYIVNNTKVVVF